MTDPQERRREKVSPAQDKEILLHLMASERPVTITPYPDGPYVVRGPFRLVDGQGNEMEVRRKSVALCRCGHSALMPFCDGSHKAVGFSGQTGCSFPDGQTPG